MSVESLPLAEPLPAPLGQQCVESDGVAAQLGVVEGRRRRMSSATAPIALEDSPERTTEPNGEAGNRAGSEML